MPTIVPIADLFTPDDWQIVLEVSLTGIHLAQPVYAAASTDIVDFLLEYVNPAGQHMTGLPERPDATLLQRFPHAVASGIFQYYRRVFETGESAPYQTNYQADGLDNYFKITARRSGERLVVSFTDTSDQDRSAVEQALRQTQATEQDARAEVEVQRQRFHEVLLQLPAYVAAYHGPDHRYQFVNPPYQGMFPHRSFAGRPFREAIPESEGLGVAALFDQVYQTGEPHYLPEMEGWFDFHGTGQPEQVFVKLSLHPLRNAQGQVDGILDFSYNITEQVLARRQLEQLNQELETRVQERTRQLSEQQALLRQLLSHLPAAIATLSGPEHRFSFANARYQYLVGDRAQVGLTVAEALPEVVEQGVIELLDRVYETGEPYLGRNVMIMLEQPPGPPHQFYYDLTYLPLRDEQGKMQGQLIFAVEVTEQVRARRQTALLQAQVLAAAQRRAQERQDILRVFANAPLAVALLREPDHQLDYWNVLFDQYFPGAERGVAVEKMLPALATPEVVAQLDRLYQSGATYQSAPTLLPGATLGSAPRYVLFTYQAYQESGRVAGVALFLQDVTEQVLGRQQVQHLNEELTATNQELQLSNARLTRTNADLDTFVYTVSHDLKSPITNLEGLLTALRDTLPLDEQQQPLMAPLLELLDSTVSRLRLTIDQLTELIQLQQTPAGPMQPVLLGPLVTAVLEDLEAEVTGGAQAQLEVAIPAGLSVRFAPANLRSIVYNLLSNALKYRHPARPAQVRVHAERQPAAVVLTVADNGLGISESQQQRLFQVFQRLHTHVEGTGVGLYMIKRLVENGGGTIAVKSQPNVGTTFTVTFPAQAH
ncbi:PAS domain-containing sensor histidine kinase [Hymenobacter crusticola]|uniref:histidine kinase n=1 Tax=Hymenobacter crusticola TaxID=1770526 RepID=A0A243W6A9_9BACT|nr:PAS domain-containing sensor histidine kinase [Hymenobacter crusticola]OUJ69181.1 hypothetical protein BXP70_26910 [Hymenobacter crusticola]